MSKILDTETDKLAVKFVAKMLANSSIANVDYLPKRVIVTKAYEIAEYMISRKKEKYALTPEEEKEEAAQDVQDLLTH